MTPTLSAAEWDSFVAAQSADAPGLSKPGGHILQTAAWAELKTAFGWSATRVVAREAGKIVAGAQLLFRPLPLGVGSIAYIPKGPLLDWANRDLSEYLLALCDEIARSQRAILLKIEPDLPEAPATAAALASYGLQRSAQTIQPRRTTIVALDGSEDEILARMKQKTRYNIRLAARKGVTTRLVADASAADRAAFDALLRATGARDDFGVHTPAYYRKALDLFSADDNVALVMAEYEGRPLAAVMAFAHGARAWYFYGASADEERQRMPAYAVQWAAMRWARARGCRTYDLWGVPDEEEPVLEREFPSRSDGLWPLYRFKRGFGGRLERSAGAWDRVYASWAYRLYDWFVRRRLPTGT